MAEFDWRPLIFALTMAVVMLIWVVGCTMLIESRSSRSSSPTPYPRVTLTTGRMELPNVTTEITPNASALTNLRRTSANTPTRTPTINPPTPSVDSLTTNISQFVSQFTIIQPTRINLNAPPPTCFETEIGHTLCLGRINNTLSQAIARVGVNVRLFLAGGRQMNAAALIEQSIIPADASAPYRVAFDAAWEDYAGVAVNVTSAELVEVEDESFAAISVENAMLLLTGSRAVVEATLRNSTEAPLRLSRAVVTLIDSRGRVCGYRVVTLGDEVLAADASLPLQVELMVQSTSGSHRSGLRHVIYVEAQKVG
jgi:hypothetical protein